MQNQKTIEAFAAAFAAALWNALPYDRNPGATNLSLPDVTAAVKLALAQTGIVLERQPVKAVSRA